MRDEIRMILGQSQYFGLAVSVAAYLFAAWLRKKTKLAILNPLLISSALIIGCLVCVGMDYETYKGLKTPDLAMLVHDKIQNAIVND